MLSCSDVYSMPLIAIPVLLLCLLEATLLFIFYFIMTYNLSVFMYRCKSELVSFIASSLIDQEIFAEKSAHSINDLMQLLLTESLATAGGFMKDLLDELEKQQSLDTVSLKLCLCLFCLCLHFCYSMFDAPIVSSSNCFFGGDHITRVYRVFPSFHFFLSSSHFIFITFLSLNLVLKLFIGCAATPHQILHFLPSIRHYRTTKHTTKCLRCSCPTNTSHHYSRL